MKIGVLGKITKVKSEDTILELISFLQNLGYETTRFHTPTEISDVDLVIILGGDGAILHSAVYAAKKDVKIIGINYGNLGFLTEYEKEEKEQIKELLSALEQNNCRILRRSLLQCEIAGRTFTRLMKSQCNGISARLIKRPRKSYALKLIHLKVLKTYVATAY